MKQIKKIKMFVVLAASLLLLFALFAVANAHGHTAKQLMDAGWDCEILPPHGWYHCFPPKANPHAERPPASIQVKVFGAEGEGHPFFGTEHLLRADLYLKNEKKQPCPQDNKPTYEDLRPGLPYFACHHFDTEAAEQ
jgi:hypothetical protein